MRLWCAKWAGRAADDLDVLTSSKHSSATALQGRTPDALPAPMPMMMRPAHVSLVCLLLTAAVSGVSAAGHQPSAADQQDGHMSRLYTDLLYAYVQDVRPVSHHNESVNVTFGFALTQVIDVDVRNQILTTNTWVNMRWRDANLLWSPYAYGNITHIHVPHEKLWKPDIVLNNNADSRYPQSVVSTDMIVRYDGQVTWISAAIYQSSCIANVRYYPFDQQVCKLTFASWAYDGTQIDLAVQSAKGDQSNYMQSSEWSLQSITVVRDSLKYSCCPNPFPFIDVNIIITRRSLFYVLHLMVPCTVISFVAVLGFWIPSDSGEKVTTGITTLLSMTVFLMMVAESMPPTSDTLPLIGMHYGVTTLLAALSAAITVYTLGMHHLGQKAQRPNARWRAFVFDLIAPLVRFKVDSAVLTEPQYKQGPDWEMIQKKSRAKQSMIATHMLMPFTHAATASASATRKKATTNRSIGETFESIMQRVNQAVAINQARLVAQDRRQAVVTEWQQVALVVDRALFMIFMSFTLTITVLLIFQRQIRGVG